MIAEEFFKAVGSRIDSVARASPTLRVEVASSEVLGKQICDKTQSECGLGARATLAARLFGCVPSWMGL